MKPNSVPYKLMQLIRRIFAAIAHYLGKKKPEPVKPKRKYKKRSPSKSKKKVAKKS